MLWIFSKGTHVVTFFSLPVVAARTAPSQPAARKW
jgi:hypothetical protein